jgi:hypothetical protein
VVISRNASIVEVFRANIGRCFEWRPSGVRAFFKVRHLVRHYRADARRHRPLYRRNLGRNGNSDVLRPTEYRSTAPPLADFRHRLFHWQTCSFKRLSIIFYCVRQGSTIAPGQRHVPEDLNTMSTTLPLESHKDRSLFLEHERKIGSAYRNRALELISICQLISQTASPKCAHEDAELKR